ncbi:hypothetical protein [Streptomyces sp. S.PB5]|uniref:hypothetical protein n=1 Tax=Streptomyces sp. S.PB5 TaxID=3020844 RepID=UPI0025AF7ECB|nr:hypothetical protein [Streptomyces sp. S.PB5]MDN3023500.1 hypothetical protein [Streptomyces sp. S.PB5]
MNDRYLSVDQVAELLGTNGQSSEKAAPIYQHSGDDRQREVTAGLDATVRKARREAEKQAQEAAAAPDDNTVDPDDQRSDTRPLITATTKKARVSDLGLSRGAGDENRTRALSLGSDGACKVT